MKKKFAVLTMALAILLAACGNKTDESKSQESTGKSNDMAKVETLKVGVMPSVDNMPFVIAHEQGFDKNHGVDLELQTFKAAKDRDAAFQAGELDGINADLVGVATYLQGGMDIKVTSATYGQFDLIATAENKSVLDLKGKQIAIMKNQGPEFSIDQMLQKAGLSESDVTLVDVPAVPSRVELLENDQAQGAIVPEPFVTMSEEKGLVSLGSTRDFGINPFVLCFTTDTIANKAEALVGMYDAYNEAVDWMKEHDKSEYLDLFVEEVGFPAELKDKIEVPDYPHIKQASIADVTLAFDWAKEHELLTDDITPAEVLSDVYFK